MLRCGSLKTLFRPRFLKDWLPLAVGRMLVDFFLKNNDAGVESSSAAVV
jgi:hypothetical protein